MNRWQLWMEMAQDSQIAASECQRLGRRRSAANRAYYAAYQAATAMIHYAGRSTPPTIRGEKREAWQHESTPDILHTDMGNITKSRDERSKLRSWLRELYKIRIQADYVASSNLFSNGEALKRVISDTGSFIKQIQATLPARDQS